MDRLPAAIESLPPQRWHEIGAIIEACDRALREASTRVTIPRRVALGVREMYALQPRLEQPRGRRALRLLEQPRFRAGFDLLLLRAAIRHGSGCDCRLVDAPAGGRCRGARAR
jgi:poly(A) polymerase